MGSLANFIDDSSRPTSDARTFNTGIADGWLVLTVLLTADIVDNEGIEMIDDSFNLSIRAFL